MLLDREDLLDRLPASEEAACAPKTTVRPSMPEARALTAAPVMRNARPDAPPFVSDGTLAASRSRAARPARTALQRIRSSSGVLTVAAGPVVGLMAWWMAGMGPMESFSLAFLVSAWIGPKLLSDD